MEGELNEQMQKAAAAEDFEKAAQFRDALQDLRRTTQKTRQYKRMPYNLPVAIEPRLDLAELAKILNLTASPVRIEGFDISNISGTFAVASMVSFREGKPDRANYRRFRIKTVTGQDDFACMAETVQRRYSRLLRERTEIKEGGAPSNFPDLIVIDGGKGQLNAAVGQLTQLGLGHIAAIGLAKEFEEIFRPGQAAPLRISHDSGALKLLQRVRDESHRFANTYNAQLRLKKISESILDEFPGIGQQRKAALLKKFGSVQRLRFATVEAIAAVPGFGGKAALELKKFLAARSSVPEQNPETPVT
jgi:excinuclease ABC subunit C